MAVLVFPVHTGQPRAAHLFVAAAQGLIAAVGIVPIPEIELQQVVVILAEVHQRVHLLVGEGALIDGGAAAVHHIGAVAGDGVVKADGPQLARVSDGGPGPPGAEDELAPCGLHLPHGRLHCGTGALFPEGDKGVVVVAG